MLTSAVLMLLSAAPLKIAATGFTVSGDDAARANVWVERFAEVMRRDQRVEVTTSADIAQLLGLERQKQLLGCAEDSTACFAELANALGADGVLMGSITRSGEGYVAAIKVVRQRDGRVWWSSSERLKGEAALLDWLDVQAEAAVNVLRPRPPPPVGALVLGGASIVALGAGATFLLLSNTTSLQAARMALDEASLNRAIDSGRGQGVIGVICLSVGGAALLTSAIWLLLPREAPAALALSPVPGGVVATIGGRW